MAGDRVSRVSTPCPLLSLPEGTVTTGCCPRASTAEVRDPSQVLPEAQAEVGGACVLRSHPPGLLQQRPQDLQRQRRRTPLPCGLTLAAAGDRSGLLPTASGRGWPGEPLLGKQRGRRVVEPGGVFKTLQNDGQGRSLPPRYGMPSRSRTPLSDGNVAHAHPRSRAHCLRIITPTVCDHFTRG